MSSVCDLRRAPRGMYYVSLFLEHTTPLMERIDEAQATVIAARRGSWSHKKKQKVTDLRDEVVRHKEYLLRSRRELEASGR
eukprot:4670557-Pleurochrysis_carterae.AAC.3